MNGGRILQDTASNCICVYTSCGRAAGDECKSAVRNELRVAFGFAEGESLLKNHLYS